MVESPLTVVYVDVVIVVMTSVETGIHVVAVELLGTG